MISFQGAAEVRLLLDTMTLIYAVESPQKLSKRAAHALMNPANLLELSSVSLAEIAIKSRSGKLEMAVGIVKQAVEHLRIRVLPYTSNHAFGLFELPLHHRDPFDRLIIAQALSEEIPIVTSDYAFNSYRGLAIFW